MRQDRGFEQVWFAPATADKRGSKGLYLELAYCEIELDEDWRTQHIRQHV